MRNRIEFCIRSLQLLRLFTLSRQASSKSIDSPLVLVVEHNVPMRDMLRSLLTGAGYRCALAGTGEESLRLGAQQPPDVVILELDLPDIDGQKVLQRLREFLTSPIIILSVRSQDVQKIIALDNGADDYLTKPFSSGELLARIRVVLRNSKLNYNAQLQVYENGKLKVDLPARQVFADGKEVRLTPSEYRLLAILVQHVGTVLTHQFLLESLWGYQETPGRSHLRVFMASLRRKIELDPANPRYLLTERNIGYRLAND
jgi:two-component system, OmpR family, KDP operon response regulator KdpE